MITVNMHEAKSRLSELVKAVEEDGEIVVLCRDGRQVAEIRRHTVRRKVRSVKPDPKFQVKFRADYQPEEPLTKDEWPTRMR